jgi:cytochrome d ubiquinol oxidase subunit II
MLGGALAVVTCAYLAAMFLTAEARSRRAPDLEVYFRRRAEMAAVVAGIAVVVGIFVLHADARRLFNRLLGAGLPLVILSAVTGVAALVLMRSGAPQLVRALVAVAVASVILGWGVAQYPYLLGTHLRVNEAAAPNATLWSLAIVFGLAAVLVAPSLILLYMLQQRGQLEGT